MVFGHNSNIRVGAATLHVQTEDRGIANALIDTTVYYRGRVLHRRTNNYFDLLPMNPDREQALKLRVDEQHRSVSEEVQTGVLQLAIPQDPEPAAKPAEKPLQPAERSAAIAPKKFTLELVNPRSWLSGRQASLQISVRDEQDEAVAGARVVVQVEGSADGSAFTGETSWGGLTLIAFEMPKITTSEAAVVIRVQDSKGAGQLRFSLRSKPRVPAI
jgi:hypothetical protein